MNNFRTLLLDIGQELTKDELKNLKFICKFIPAGRAEFIEQPHELFLEMERQTKLSENNRETLASLLEQIDRIDLKNKLLGIKEPVRPLLMDRTPLTANVASEKVTPKLLLELRLAERLSTDWKFVGRYLGLEDHEIRNIEDTYRRTQERSHEMLTKWLQKSKDITIGSLVTALKSARRTDLAEEIQGYVKEAFPSVKELGDALPDDGGMQAQPVEHDGIEEKHPVQDSDPNNDKRGSFKDETIYDILEVIGAGGFSKVYLIMKKDTEEKYAVKAVELGMADKITEMRVKALEKEITILKELKNQYIIKYLSSETSNGTFALFMEYMPGRSIADKIYREGPIKEKIVRNYTWQILNGLQYLHERKVIHRDIKGANILLDEDHTHLKLTDFGISLALEDIATSTGHCLSNQGGMVASLFWTSPELLCSEKYSFNTDIWSLGCTVVEMLTGDPPLRAEDLMMMQAMYKISNHEVSAPESCSSLAKDFIDHCFRKSNDRPSASSLLNQEHFAFPTI